MNYWLESKNVPPWVVGLVRGIIEGILLAVLNVIIVFLGSNEVPAWLVPFNGILVILIRQAEGLIDQSIDPNQNRVKDSE